MSSFVRTFDPGMGEAVAARTILRPKGGGKESLADVAHRVAFGNVSLVDRDPTHSTEYQRLRTHIEAGTVLMSGRHLQHGDETQNGRNIEVFTNCSTAATTFLKFYLLLNGSGVGRSYDDQMMMVDWRNAPALWQTMAKDHPDNKGHWPELDDTIEALLASGLALEDIVTFFVPDSREGWAQAVELYERMAFEEQVNKTLILDFSQVRPKGSPIKGMQNRPSSGPVPLMEALRSISRMGGAPEMPLWEQSMWADHFLAACVAVGGARRAARIAVKYWKDPGILEFITIKKKTLLGEMMYSSNNSIAVDAEFWANILNTDSPAHAIFEAVTRAQFFDGTGEPGFINIDKLNQNREGLDAGSTCFAGFSRYTPDAKSGKLLAAVSVASAQMQYPFIVNPCGEVVLHVRGAYCVIADVVPFHARTLEEARDAFLTAARALMRVNKMEALYGDEVRRTNRIGVGFTGIFEFAWLHFGVTFTDLIADYDRLMAVADWDTFQTAAPAGPADAFWQWMAATREAVIEEITFYAFELGMEVPHTALTVKPAGTTSKLFGLTEGAHLPAMAYYLRWVQFQHGDPLIEQYRAAGYPVIDKVKNASGKIMYPNVAIVGFPTAPVITTLGIPDHLFTTATDASLEAQYQWVSLIEKMWLGDVRGNQVSYTAKYNTQHLSFTDYQNTVMRWQPRVRCITVMPASDWRESKALYGYVPEQPVTQAEYDAIVAKITTMTEDISLDSLQCASGACPL